MSTHSHGHGHHGHSHGAGGACPEPGEPGGRRPTHQVWAEERAKDRTRLMVALVLTSVIALAEAVGGYITNSLALMSDAGHMLTDISALVLSLLAIWFAGKPATHRKTYGYYRLEILSALLNGILLAAITVVIGVEAVRRFRHPAAIHVQLMLVVATIGLLANLLALAFLHQGRSLNMRAAFLHIVGDALASVGVIAGAVLIWWKGWLWVDPAISAGISVVIVVGAYRLLRDAVDVLLEAVPAHVDMESVRVLMAGIPGVVAVHDLHVWTISSGMYALSAHLVVLDPMTCNNDQILSAVKHDLYDRFGIDHTTIQIESETYSHLGEVH